MRLWIAEESVCETSEGSRRKKETNPCPKRQNNGACAKHGGFRPNEIAQSPARFLSAASIFLSSSAFSADRLKLAPARIGGNSMMYIRIFTWWSSRCAGELLPNARTA